MKTPTEILNTISDVLEISIAELANKIGYDRPQALYDVINGKTKRISGTLANRIISVYPNFNSSWILTGEGEMLKTKTESSLSTPEPVTLPADVWELIKTQAESIKTKDKHTAEALDIIRLQAESLAAKDRQTTEVIELLKEQIKKGEGVDENYHAAIQAVGE